VGIRDHEDFVFRINGMGAERAFTGCFADITETPVIRASLKSSVDKAKDGRHVTSTKTSYGYVRWSGELNQ
jgi:hypothetical protein